MWQLHPPEKSHPLFPSNPPLKVEILSSPPPSFLKIWLEAQPPPPPPHPCRKGGEGVHTMYRSSDPNLDLFWVWILNASPFCKNYAKFYFDAKHLESGLNSDWWIFWAYIFKKCPFWPIWNAALNFKSRPWLYRYIYIVLLCLSLCMYIYLFYISWRCYLLTTPMLLVVLFSSTFYDCSYQYVNW